MEVKLVSGIPTHVFYLRNESECRLPLVVIIPGSPGMGHFYIPFASKLFAIGQERYDVSIVSHAGHSPGHYKDTTEDVCKTASGGSGPKSEQGAPVSEEEVVVNTYTRGTTTDWYSLQDQIAHKLTFIDQELKTRPSLILIGHSIGCWMILNMLPQLGPLKVHRVFMLFPTIEKMALTPNAQSFSSYLWSSLRIPFTGLVWMANRLIPNRVKKFVLDRHFHTTPSEHLTNVTQGATNIDEKSIYNVLKMAKQEMAEVVDPPLQVIDENIDKMVFYYGVGDKWNVESCYRDMAVRYPDKEVHLCERGINHAFVECSSNEMAEFVHSKLNGLT